MYKSTVGAFKPYDPAATKPTDLATTIILNGSTVDYIVRLETGVINRAIYQISFLHTPGTLLPTPTSGTPGWNGALVYAFGGGCGAAYRQGRNTNNVLTNLDAAPDALDLGYAMASSTLNVLGNNCNDVTSAETAAMVKEHFVEQFGVPRHTIGAGGSGGSMQQHLIAQNYPGLLDGLLTGYSFPDTLTVVHYTAACPLLNAYFNGSNLTWAPDQKTAVSGFAKYEMCSTAWTSFMPRWVSPLGTGCDAAIPRNVVYDPVTNPTGSRCSYFDNLVNVFGKDASGAARRPLDNVGVQYGLKPFNAGLITAEQFVDLNEKIGGLNADASVVPQRMVADPESLRIAYQSGRVNEGVGLDAVPILDTRSFTDANTPADVHTFHATFKTRARLQATNGSAANHVMWIAPTVGALGADLATPTSPTRSMYRLALPVMEKWLTAIKSDASSDPAPVKVVRNKPADAADTCFDALMNKTVEPLVYEGGGHCGMTYRASGDPMLAAGEPLTGDILKCQRKPLVRTDYQQQLTDVQWARLNVVFTEGVCDYSKSGVSQQRITANWQSY